MINTIDHIINIDLANKINMNHSINIKKNDTNSHKFVINIFNSSVAYDLTGTTSRIYFQKADDTKVFLDCTLDNALTGKLSCLLTTQALSYAGLVASEITIYGTAGEILTSVTFNFTVSEVIRDDVAIESTSEFTSLTNALNALDEAVVSIPTVEALNVDLQNNIVTGDALDITLKDDIATGNITDTNIKDSTIIGDATDADLKADIIIAGQNEFATEITNARGGEINLDTRLDKVDTSLADNVQQLLNVVTVNPFMTFEQIQSANDTLINGGRLEFALGAGNYEFGSNSLELKPNVEYVARGNVKINGDEFIFYVNYANEDGNINTIDNKKNILIDGFSLSHNTKTFYEFNHLIAMRSVSNIEIRNCNFIGWRGDAICFGGNTPLGIERHNENIYIHDCFFDGINNDNRNGISVIDGKNVYIERNKFINCTKAGMPGAIDFEPNKYSFSIIKNIKVIDNHFSEIKGNGCVIIHTWNEMSNWSNEIDIRGNTFDSSIGESLVITSTKQLTSTTPNMNINIEKNIILQGLARLENLKGINVSKNIINTIKFGSSNDLTISCIDVNIKDNVFSGANISNYCLQLCNTTRFTIDNNTFEKPQTGVLFFIFMYGNSVTTISDNITISNNKFIKGISSVTDSVKVQNHTLSSITNRYLNNISDVTLLNGFLYILDNKIYTSAPPTIGTYNAGVERYNDSLAGGSYEKWVCFVGGTPGTWVPVNQLTVLKGLSSARPTANLYAGYRYLDTTLATAGKPITYSGSAGWVDSSGILV